MLKIIQLTKYGTLAASTRQRFDQYRPYLEAEGCAVEPKPLFEDRYLEELYNDKRRNRCYIASRYVSRLQFLLTHRNFDLIWLHCEAFPYLPSIFENLVRFPKKPIILDYDDAIFHNYDLHERAIVRVALANKIGRTIRLSQASFCGNGYLEHYASRYSNSTSVVPTVVDIDNYVPRNGPEVGPGTNIGWIGTPSTWREYMIPMLPVLSEVADAVNGKVTMIGGDSNTKHHPHLVSLPWTEETEVARIQEMDIGIMPLTDTPWARGKCGYKLIQYMACGLPVVASPVGVNAEIVEHGVNGFLAETEEEWRGALMTLLRDPEMRRRMGQEGRRKVESHYSLQVWGPRVARMIRDVAEKGRRCST